MVGLWLDFNRTAASLAYVIVLKNRAKKAGLLTRLGCHSFRATGITSICSTAASSSTLSRSAAPPFRTATCGSSREQRRVFPWRG